MSDDAIEGRVCPALASVWLDRGLLALVGLAFLTKLHLLFVLNVNWDEFYFLHSIYDHLRGELTSPLQSFHVHFFTWLRHVPGNEVDQVIAARVIMFGFSLGSGVLIYRIGRHFLDPTAALFALLCYLAFSFVVEHGTSFRADPIASFFCLSSVVLVLCAGPPWRTAFGAGLALAIALMVTIKSVFYLPIVAALLIFSLSRPEDRRRRLARVAVFAVALISCFAALYLLHRAALGAGELESPAGIAANAANKVLRLDNFFPRWRYLVVSVIENAVIWAVFGLGAATLIGQVRKGTTAERAAAAPMLILLLPLASFLIYRNAFPYFYAFILPLPMLACGAIFSAVAHREPSPAIRSPKLIATAMMLAVAVNLGATYAAAAQPALQLQRQTIALVHRLFPEPVAYIDRCAMISSYRKVGFFMSTWGMENYKDHGEPIFRDLVIRERPPFLLANIASLDPSVPPERLRALGGHALFDEDHAVLASNYVHHWGALYVAGKTLSFPSGSSEIDFEILIPGTYTLESERPLIVDGRTVASGETVHFETGRHRAKAGIPGPHKAILRWGERLYRPAQGQATEPLFTGF